MKIIKPNAFVFFAVVLIVTVILIAASKINSINQNTIETEQVNN